MTESNLAQSDIAHFALQMARNPRTLARFQELMDDAERRQQISERLKSLRERRGLTQPQIARQIDAELRTYQNWEAGGGTSHENYERLAEALGVSYDYLITGAEFSPPPDDILKQIEMLNAKLDLLLEGQDRFDAAMAQLAQALDERRSAKASPRPKRASR